MGPCGHYYHFYCIKERMDEDKNECPECGIIFHNGLADMKLVEREEEAFTISDT